MVSTQGLIFSGRGSLPGLLFFMIGVSRLASEDFGVLVVVPGGVAGELIYLDVS